MTKVTLGEVAEVTSGQGAPQDEGAFCQTGGYSFVRAGSLRSLLAGTNESTLERLPEDSAKKHGMRLFPAGTVVFAKSGMSATLGLVYQLENPCYVVSHLAAIIPGENLYAAYFRHWQYAHSPVKLVPDSAYPSIKTSTIAEQKIALPPMAEQRRIAATLDRAAAIRQKHAEAQRLATDLVPAVFEEMFGKFSANVKKAHLSDVASISSGVAKGKRYPGVNVRSVPYMAVMNVQDGFLRTDVVKEMEASERDIKETVLQKGDLLMTEGGDPDKLGRGAVWDGRIPECIHQNHIFRVRPHENVLLPEYLAQYVCGPKAKAYFLRAAKQTTGIATINMTQLSSLPVPLPRLKQQGDFVRKMGVAKLLRERLLRRAEKLSDLERAMAARYF